MEIVSVILLTYLIRHPNIKSMIDAIKLKQYISLHRLTQWEIATKLGFTQGAVSQILQSDRDVYIREQECGELQAIELKIITNNKKNPTQEQTVGALSTSLVNKTQRLITANNKI